LSNLVHGLYAIADSRWLSSGEMVNAVHAALMGGARAVQLRDKTALQDEVPRNRLPGFDSATRARLARDLGVLCGQFGVPFIVNDDLALAARSGAQGVHLGRDDASVAEARALLGPQAIIGVSCYDDLERGRSAEMAGADYVAFGRFFPSRTKPQAVPASVELLHAARRELRLPIVAIGGITPENGASLVDAGASALAVVEGLFGQTDIRSAAASFTALFKD